MKEESDRDRERTHPGIIVVFEYDRKQVNRMGGGEGSVWVASSTHPPPPPLLRGKRRLPRIPQLTHVTKISQFGVETGDARIYQIFSLRDLEEAAVDEDEEEEEEEW